MDTMLPHDGRLVGVTIEELKAQPIYSLEMGFDEHMQAAD